MASSHILTYLFFAFLALALLVNAAPAHPLDNPAHRKADEIDHGYTDTRINRDRFSKNGRYQRPYLRNKVWTDFDTNSLPQERERKWKVEAERNMNGVVDKLNELADHISKVEVLMAERFEKMTRMVTNRLKILETPPPPVGVGVDPSKQGIQHDKKALERNGSS